MAEYSRQVFTWLLTHYHGWPLIAVSVVGCYFVYGVWLIAGRVSRYWVRRWQINREIADMQRGESLRKLFKEKR